MCGIVGFAGRERAVPYLLDCLEKLEYRGYDSAGVALSGEKGIEVVKRKGKLSVLTSALLSQKKNEAACGIGHTRWATHGSPDEKNAHPQVSRCGYFAVVHNGIIENYEKLKKELVSQGCVFTSETDTEVIAQLLEKNYRGDFLSAAKETLHRLEGSYAIAVMCSDYPGKIFCSRWGSPIVLAEGESGNFVSSDVMSLVKYTDRVYKLEGGESALVDCDGIDFFDRDMKMITKTAEIITHAVEDVRKDGYEHFMLKEIYEQGIVCGKLLDEYAQNGNIYFEAFGISDRDILSLERIAFIGCGSAYHAGLAGKYVTEKLTGICASAEIASEWRYSGSTSLSDCLCVFISQSGETADTLAALRKAKSEGAKTLGIVNVVSSSVACESDCVIYTKAGPEIAVATTKAYTAQLICLYLLAIKIARIRGKISLDEQRRLVDELTEAKKAVEAVLETTPEIAKALADELYSVGQLYFMGRNTDYAAAMEGALKLKEVSYIPCEAYAAGELKHGTISLIERGTPVVVLMGNSELFAKTVSNIREVRSRGARVIALCREDLCGKVAQWCDRVIPLPKGEGMFSALYEGAVLQLLAYYTAKKRDCEIDKPRNLAKSVTVE